MGLAHLPIIYGKNLVVVSVVSYVTRALWSLVNSHECSEGHTILPAAKAAGITGMINCGGPMVVYLTDTLSPFLCQQNHARGLPWWLSGKESTCQCRRHGSVPGLGRSICRGVTKPMSDNYWAHVPQLIKPKYPRHHAPQQEKPPQWEAHALQLKSRLKKRKPAQQWRPSTAKEKKKKKSQDREPLISGMSCDSVLANEISWNQLRHSGKIFCSFIKCENNVR